MSTHYDLEDRTEAFAKRCREFVRKLPKDLTNLEYAVSSLNSKSETNSNDKNDQRLKIGSF